MEYKINNYPDGTSYITIPKQWEGTMQDIVFRVNTYEDLWNLNMLCEVLQYKNVEAVITIPNLIDSQADRRFASNQSSSLYKIAEMLNQYENVFFKIFHPHNPEVVEALFSSVEIMDNSEFIGKVLKLC